MSKETAVALQKEQESEDKTLELAQPSSIKLSEEGIAIIKQNIKLAERLVMEVLEQGVDYGIIPGTPAQSLWDPGASKIMAAFNCYPEPTILRVVENEEFISYIIQSRLISRQTGNVVGNGIAAASTRETKHKYRWAENPEEEGYPREKLKKKGDKYRIPNPEYGDLVNTIVKMAAKRSEVDAAESLPGVGSALRKLFQRQMPKAGEEWKHFWGKIRQIGLTDKETHSILGVASMKDWLQQGKTLDEALDILMAGQPQIVPEGIINDALEQKVIAKADEVKPEKPKPEKPKRDPETIKTIQELYKACYEDWVMQPLEVIHDLGYKNQIDITELPKECYLKIRAVRC